MAEMMHANATIPKSAELMKEAGKKFDPVIYEGAGHGFMRAGEAPDASQENKNAREEAWARWKASSKLSRSKNPRRSVCIGDKSEQFLAADQR